MSKKSTLGSRLTHARLSLAARRGADVSKTWLAGQVGVTQSAVSQWEADATEPSLRYLVKLAAILGVEAGWLAFGEVPEPAPLINPATDRKFSDADRAADEAAVRASKSATQTRRRKDA